MLPLAEPTWETAKAEGGGMFFVRATGEDRRTTVCTADASRAVLHHGRIIRLGLTPVVTDQRGRELTLDQLRRRIGPSGGQGLQ